MTGSSAGRRPIIGDRLIILLLGLIVALLWRLRIPRLRGLIVALLLGLIGGLRPPVNFAGYATPGAPEQSADTRALPGVVVISGGPDAGPQGRAQTRTGVQVGVLTRRGATCEQTQAQQTYQYPLLSQAQAPKALSCLHDSPLPKGLIGPFKYLEASRGKM